VVLGWKGEVSMQQTGLNGGVSERDSAAELFERHSAAIYRYCLRRLRSPEEAEDALQATYLNAWRSLKGGFEPQDPRPWLFQIAANVCTSELRSQLGGTRVELRAPGALEDLVQVEQPEREAFLDLTAAVRDLPDRQRHALLLRDWQGLRYDEIATRMAVSGAAVETLLFRARNKVGATLESRDWKPKLVTSARALIVWPFGIIHAKSAVAGGASNLKMGLLLACGTVAPLVAFGVLQVTALEPEGKGDAARRPPARESVLMAGPATSALDERVVLQAVDREADPKRTPGARQPDDASGPRHESKGPESKGPGDPAPTPAGGPVDPPASGPPPPPAEDEDKVKVTLCHGTPSEAKPGVTLNVAPQAAQNGLSQDPTGTCG
jgi:RNA polymerase sigma factor (sigma-70 family)